MPKSFTDDVEEGEICDDEEIDINQFNIIEDSSALINRGTKYFQSLYHGNNKALLSNTNSEIPHQSAIYPKINEGDNLQINDNKEEDSEAKENKPKNFYDCDMNEKNDEEYFLDHKVTDENESEDEFKVANSRGEESDDDDNEFTDEIICNEEIIAANEFHSKIAALPVNAEDRTDKSTTEDVDEMQINLAEEVPVDDSWIFHSLGGDTETVDIVVDKKQILHEESNNQKERIIELERKFAEEKENYVRNMYSLLVTARAQIAVLKEENRKLEIKLEGNCTLKCPECKHEICIRNNLLKPKHIKVLRGRCAIEMLFNNLTTMEEWLAANYLDINPDGLPVVLKIPQKPTLTSTNSLLAPKASSIHDIRRNTAKVTSTLSSVYRNPESVYPVAIRQNIQCNKYSAKKYEKLNYMTQDKKTQERSDSSNAYNSSDKREKQSYEKKLSEPNTYEECHHISCTYTSPDRSFDRDRCHHFNSSRSLSFHGSRGTLNVSSSNRNGIGQKYPLMASDNFENRLEYRNPSTKYHRRPVRSSMYHRPTEKISYQSRNHSRSNRIKSRK
ncbi:Protease Do-like 2, chloroplastic [Dirofilaria immitis]